MQVFHVTERRLLPGILVEGLRPQCGPRSQEAGEHVPAVYCFTRPEYVEDALMNWLGDWFEETNTELVILELDLSDTLARHNDVDYEVAVTDCIPPAAICGIHREAAFPG